MAETAVTAEMVEAWFDAFGKHRRTPLSAEAHPIEAIFATPTAEGLVLQLVFPSGNRLPLMVNAFLALAMRKAIDLCGEDGGWMGATDEIIVQGPSGPRPWRPQA